MRVLIAVDLNDDDLTEAYGIDPRHQTFGPEWDDLILSLAARLQEAGYAGPSEYPIRGELVTVGDVTGVLSEFLSAAVLGSADESADHISATVLTMVEAMYRG